MNSVGIDALMKNSQTVPKAKSSASPEDGGQFKDYLREATSTQQQPSKEQPTSKTKLNVPPAQSTNKEQDSAKPPEEQASPSGESAEQIEEPTTESEVDEVLLSAAAIAVSVGETLITESPVTKFETVPEVAAEIVPEIVSAETTPTETTQPQEGQEAATDQNFLPELEQALATNPDTEGEITASSETNVSGEAAANGDAIPAVAEQAVTQEPAATQVTTELSGGPKVAVDTATESDGDTENTKAVEHKASKPVVSGQHVAAEQLVAQVAATLTSADSTPETKHQITTETGSLPSLTSQTQQQPTAADTARDDAQSVNSDQNSRMPTVDRARFVQRVANAFRSAQQNDGHIQLRLSPPELGSLRIEIAVRHGVLSANLETETADARQVLLDNLPALRHRLAEQDIRIDKFNVDIRREGGQSDGQAGAQDRQAQQQSQRATMQNRIRTTTHAEVVSTRVLRAIPTSVDANLDVRI